MHYKSVVLSERRSIPGDGHVGQLTPAGSASGRPSEGYGPPPPESFPYQRRRRGDPVRARAGWRQSLYGAGRKRPGVPGRRGWVDAGRPRLFTIGKLLLRLWPNRITLHWLEALTRPNIGCHTVCLILVRRELPPPLRRKARFVLRRERMRMLR